MPASMTPSETVALQGSYLNFASSFDFELQSTEAHYC